MVSKIIIVIMIIVMGVNIPIILKKYPAQYIERTLYTIQVLFIVETIAKQTDTLLDDVIYATSVSPHWMIRKITIPSNSVCQIDCPAPDAIWYVGIINSTTWEELSARANTNYKYS